MNITTKIRGELRPVNILHSINAARNLTVREDPKPYGSSSTTGTTSPSIPPDEIHARDIARQSLRWYAFATERTKMRPGKLLRKSVESACFSTTKGSSSLAIPTKLVGVSSHQRQLWTMVRNRVPRWTPLELEVSGKSITVLFDDVVTGHIQRKHYGWLKPLLPFGVQLYHATVTGSDRAGYTLGHNLVVGHVGEALDRLLDALGEAGMDGTIVDRPGGDGASTAASQAPTTAANTQARPVPDHGGDGAANGLQLVSSGLSVAKAQADTNADDVVLYRDIDGSAKATVKHVVRHSPTGLEWGYDGSGPADLARSILLAFTDEANTDRLYQRFKAEVIAAIPRAGGVIRATDVRAWVAANDG